MRFPEEVSKDAILRLRRIEGQIRGIQRLVEEGSECGDIVTQLTASKSALDRVGFKLMASGLRHCATSDDLDADELEKLFLRLA